MVDVQAVKRRQVRGWFGKHLIAEHRAGVGWADRYVAILKLRFAGLRVTNESAVRPVHASPRHRGPRRRRATAVER